MNRKILIIDDEEDFCLIMKNYLKKRNFDVHLAFNLNIGMAQLKEVKPDILFLDNNLPDGQGWDCVAEIVENNPQLSVYLVSAHSNKSAIPNPPPNVTVWEKPISFQKLDQELVKD